MSKAKLTLAYIILFLACPREMADIVNNCGNGDEGVKEMDRRVYGAVFGKRENDGGI